MKNASLDSVVLGWILGYQHLPLKDAYLGIVLIYPFGQHADDAGIWAGLRFPLV